ncbi:MAG: hypothetical protein PHW10_04705 [Candidatus Peribacteraceae bacterium]|nr:hypothetical protein [Candidatus Peribacteraceae bacterium]
MPALRFLLIALLLSAPSASAEEGSLPGISAYTKRVLERSRAAQEETGGEGGGGGAWQTMDAWTWIQNSVSGIFAVRSSDLLRADASVQLAHMSPCLRADTLLLLAEMDAVRAKLREANDSENGQAILRLTKLYTFLGERLRVLTWGGTKPGNVDTGWSNMQLFDPASASGTIKKEKMCPFSTKYFDMSLNGKYGCTPDIIDEALRALEAGRGNAESFPFDEETAALRKEKEALEALLEKLDDARDEDEDENGDQVEGCVETWPGDFHVWSGGAFTRMPSRRYRWLTELLWNIELLRPSPFLPLNFTTWITGSTALHPLLAEQTRVFSGGQTMQDAGIKAGTVEAEAIEEAFAPLSETIGKLSRLVSTMEEDGEERSLRAYVRDLAYFLRRSCMNRDCNASLERIIKIAGADACFPFTKGDGDREEDMSQEDWEKKIEDLIKECKKEAEVEEL